MSRRRPVDPDGRTPQQPDPGKKIRVVCTGKEEHAEVSFGYVMAWPDGDGWRFQPFLKRAERSSCEPTPGMRIDVIHKDDGRTERSEIVARIDVELFGNYPLKCGSCGRDKPLRVATLERHCAGLTTSDAAGKLDVSKLSD
jgi:hypothetical protein